VSTLSSGNSDLDEKVRAKAFALEAASDNHSVPCRKVGMDTTFALRCNSSRFKRHHRLLDLGNFASLVFVSRTQAARSSFKMFVHCLPASLKRSMFFLSMNHCTPVLDVRTLGETEVKQTITHSIVRLQKEDAQATSSD